MRLVTRARTAYEAWSVLSGGVADVVRLRRTQHGARGGSPTEFRVRSLPGVPLLCRPGTTDPTVLLSTFAGRYHLPPEGAAAPRVVLDLGANVGYVAAHFATLYPHAKIISVELDAGNAEMARRNLRPFGSRCEVIEAAAWTHDGRVTYEGEMEQSFKVTAADPGVAPAPGATGPRTARAMTIDTLLAERGLDRVDYLKMDVEGAERPLLGNAGGWLAKTSCLTVEVHQPVPPEEIQALLRNAGFVVSRDHRPRACVMVTAQRPTP